jgi:hypothetical protein
MRLKENQTNYHASSVRRRLLRQSLPADAPPRPVRGKKDRRRWCGGHVGREHKPVCMDYRELKFRGRGLGGPADSSVFKNWKVLACTLCGKELEFYFPWQERPSPPPAWVT